MVEYFAKYPIPVLDSGPLMLTYGTAGFRTEACWMDHVVVRCAALAVVRSYVAKKAAVGLCITASHNPAEDNGVKLIAPDAELLCATYEAYATALVNAKHPLDEFKALLSEILGANDDSDILRHPDATFAGCCVLVGQDTRESSPRLARLACDMIIDLGATCLDFSAMTTPQMHFFVLSKNQRSDSGDVLSIVRDMVPEYYEWFSLRLADFLGLWKKAGTCMTETMDNPILRESLSLTIDGANGVGGLRMRNFSSALLSLNVHMVIKNDGSKRDDVVNYKCGTDYIQQQKSLPINFGADNLSREYPRCCAFDGDADRLLYFTILPATEKLVLLDGDRIASLLATMLVRLLCQVAPFVVFQPVNSEGCCDLNIGIIQTGYANGASTHYLNDIFCRESPTLKKDCYVSWSVIREKTGVKHLSRKAMDFDVAIYFESNGHGTVITNFAALCDWGRRLGVHYTNAYRLLEAFLRLFERGVGDAMVDVLGVELALRYLELPFIKWMQLYNDLPSVQRKVPLQRAYLQQLITNDKDETMLEAPVTLATAIREAVEEMGPACRAFVRPSGTEDICRIYAEAPTQALAKRLASTIETLVRKTHFETRN